MCFSSIGAAHAAYGLCLLGLLLRYVACEGMMVMMMIGGLLAARAKARNKPSYSRWNFFFSCCRVGVIICCDWWAVGGLDRSAWDPDPGQGSEQSLLLKSCFFLFFFSLIGELRGMFYCSSCRGDSDWRVVGDPGRSAASRPRPRRGAILLIW